jgi:DNA-nicking Smr family endonuclease
VEDANDNEVELFLEAVKDARPLKPKRVHHAPLRPKPIPKQFIRDEQQALADS